MTSHPTPDPCTECQGMGFVWVCGDKKAGLLCCMPSSESRKKETRVCEVCNGSGSTKKRRPQRKKSKEKTKDADRTRSTSSDGMDANAG